MKIYVNVMPVRANQCCFALLTQVEYDDKLLANCSLKCNSFPMSYGHEFSYVPNSFTCSLENKCKCPFLKEMTEVKE